MPDAREVLKAALSDRYAIDRELGRGGMATVYLAHDIKHDRDVAIKVLHEDLGATLGPERFLAEIKTTAKLQHPHILPLLDSGEASGLLFYVMPYVAGDTLRDRLTRETQLPIEDAVRIAREIADALGHAHGHGIIHRDIKPENILLQGGHALVADFGIALAVQRAGGSRLTQTGLSLGTPQYMAPEQAMGEKTIGAAADIYALGAVTYEMLTGDPPFTGTSVQAVVAKVLSSDPERPTVTRKTVPAAVEAAVLKALAKLPADRFASAAEFAIALTTTVAPIGGSGTGVHEAIPRSRRAARVLLAVAVLGWAAAIALFVRGAIQPPAADAGDSARYTLALPDSVSLTQGVLQQGRVAVSRDGGTIVFDASLPNGHSMLYLQSSGAFDAQPIPGTESAADRTFFLAPDGRSVALIDQCQPGCTVRRLAIDGGSVTTLATDIAYVNSGTWTVDSAIVLAARDWTELDVIPTTPGQVRRIATPNFAVDGPELLPDGKFAVATVQAIWQGAPARSYGYALMIGLVSLVDGSVYALTDRGMIRADSAADSDWLIGFRPRIIAGNRLLFVRNDGSAMTIGFDARRHRLTSQPTVVLTGFAITGWGTPVLDVSADGTLVYAPGPNQSLKRLGWATTDGRVDTLAIPPAQFTAFATSPDGARVAVVVASTSAAAELRVYDTRSGAVERVADFAQWDVAWSANGEWIVYGTGNGETVRRRASRLSERESMTFGGAVLDVSPDGGLVTVSRFGSVARHGLWVVPWGHPEAATLIDSSTATGCGLLSPDHESILYQSAADGSYATYVAKISAPGSRRKISAVNETCGEWSSTGVRGDKAQAKATRSAEGWSIGPSTPLKGYAPSADLIGFDHEIYRGDRRLQAIDARLAPMTRLRVAKGWVQSLGKVLSSGTPKR